MPNAFRVLVPLDGSPEGDLILPHVERLHLPARLEADLRLHLLAAAASPEERAGLSCHLHGVQRRLLAMGVEAEVDVREGAQGPAILAAAAELRPDLVAMASCGQGVSRFLRPSVAEEVLAESDGPMFLVTPRVDGPRRVSRILVPLDGTERSATVLPAAARFAAAEDAAVVLLRTVWDFGTRPMMSMCLRSDRFTEGLVPWRERLERAGLTVQLRGDGGDELASILRVAEEEEVDLIAMTARARRGLRRLVDRSVAERVLQRSPRPLLLVQAP